MTNKLLKEFLFELKQDKEFIDSLSALWHSNDLSTHYAPRSFAQLWIEDAERILDRKLSRYEKASVSRIINNRYHYYVKKTGSIEAGVDLLKKVLDEKLTSWIERDELERKFGSRGHIDKSKEIDPYVYK